MDVIDQYLQALLGEKDDGIDEDDELYELDDDDVDETFGVDEEYDEWAHEFAAEESEAVAYAAKEGDEWKQEFADNLRRLTAERHFYSDADEYVEEQDPKSGETVRLKPGMHLCKDDDE